jgi:hypothetical protein
VVREGGGGAWAAVALGCWAICYGSGPVNNTIFDLFKNSETKLNLIRSKVGLPKLKVFSNKIWNRRKINNG